MTMTGKYGLEMRIARNVSMPLMPGNMTSRITRSIASSVSRTASACSPLEAMTTSKPSLRRTASSTSRRTSSSSTIRIRIALGPSVRFHPAATRQRYRELRSVAWRALYADVSIRSVQDTAGDRQPETRSSLPAFGRDQRLENPAENLRRDSFAVVFDPDIDPFSTLLGCNPDVAPLVHRVSSIEENVGENLLQVVKVPADFHLRDVAEMDRDLF